MIVQDSGPKLTGSEVWCKTCHEWIDTSKIDIQDVSEDAEGRDKVEFMCVCDDLQISLVRRSG